MVIKYQQRINKCKLNRWRKCDSCSVMSRRDKVSYWISWGKGTTWSGMNILSRRHRPWIFWYIQKVGLVRINNPLMRIVAVEEVVKKGHMRHAFSHQRQGCIHGVTKENEKQVPGRDGTTSNATCYNCRKPDQLAYNCSEAGRTVTCSLQVIYNFTQKKIQKNDPMDNNWVLLDTCSSASVLKNASLAKNVTKCNTEDKLVILTNSGHLSFNWMWDLLLLPMSFHDRINYVIIIFIFWRQLFSCHFSYYDTQPINGLLLI